jgi:GTP-binding protein HflX
MERQPLLIDGQDTKALLVMLRTNVHDHTVFRVRLDELKALVESLGIEVVGEVVQTRYRPFAKYYVGKGKVEDIRRKVRRLKANVVIFYNIINSSQKLNLIQAVHCEVIDRFELTLEIFDQMASDTLSKLQIQAARLEKQAPFYKLQASVNYQYDRPFFRAGGEYGFHAKMRELTRSQAKINEEIDKLMEEKSQRIWQRKKLGFPVICIAGYYNAGKTYLFNRFTGDSKPVSDRPFTTLSSKYQKRYIDWETTVLFIDTIGFVLDLDPRLIESFKLNLLDIRSSDLVILLLDLSDPMLNLDMKLNEGIWLLRDIGVSRDRIIVVINKSDLDPEKAAIVGEKLELDSYLLPWIVVSAEDKTNVPELLDLIAKRLKHIKDNPPEPVLLSPFRRAETTVNRILAEYPVQYKKRYYNPFHSLVGTILSQNTSGSNRESAFNSLDREVGINPYYIDEAPESKIKDAIRSAGMYNQRTKVLKRVSRIIIEKYEGNLKPLFDLPFNEARDRLMELPGVGPKTADVALMFAADRKVIPVDRHIERISKRLEIVQQNANYEVIRSALQDAATPDRFLEVHLSLIKFGRETCTARNPNHEECLMNDICPFYEKLLMTQKRLNKEKADA